MSDYDFFVVPDDDCGMFRLAGFFGKLQEALGDVDVVCDDPSERERGLQREDLRGSEVGLRGLIPNPGDRHRTLR